MKRSSDVHGFHILPQRWVVERTFAWLGRYRRLSKDYEAFSQTSEVMIYAAMVYLMVRRLAADSITAPKPNFSSQTFYVIPSEVFRKAKNAVEESINKFKRP